MSKKLRLQLKELQRLNGRINPDPAWVAENKATLFAQIGNTVNTKEKSPVFSFARTEQFVSIFMPRYVATMARPMLVLALALGATIGGWVAGVSASQNSLPGDALYGVKLATEKTQVTLAAVTGDKEAETQLHLKFAGRRSQEVKKVIEENHPDAPQRAEAAIEGLKKSIESAKQNVEDVGEKDVVRAVVLAKDVSKKTTEINKDLTEAVAVAKPEQSLTKEVVADTKQIVTTTGLETIKIVAEKSTKVTDEKTADTVQKQVKEIVEEKISTLSQEKQVSADALKTLTDLPAQSATTTASNLSPTSTSTPLVPAARTSTSTAAVRETVKDIVEKVDKSSELVDKMIGDAKVLVEQKNIIEAIEKVKEVTKVSTETTRAVTEATETVKKILAEPIKTPDALRTPAPSQSSTTPSASPAPGTAPTSSQITR